MVIDWKFACLLKKWWGIQKALSPFLILSFFYFFFKLFTSFQWDHQIFWIFFWRQRLFHGLRYALSENQLDFCWAFSPNFLQGGQRLVLFNFFALFNLFQANSLKNKIIAMQCLLFSLKEILLLIVQKLLIFMR